MEKNIITYVKFLGVVLVIMVINFFWPFVLTAVSHSEESQLLTVFSQVIALGVLGTLAFYISRGTPFPSFVTALLLGLLAQRILEPTTSSLVSLSTLVTLGAMMIIFGGGLDTPWKNFRRLLPEILSLSFVGLVFTALALGIAVHFLAGIFGLALSVPAAVLLGAALASTDPAAIIPVLKTLRFKNRDTKDIVVSESAMTDVTGTLLTVAFLTLFASGVIPSNIGGWYEGLFTATVAEHLLIDILVGGIAGCLGWLGLQLIVTIKRGHGQEFEADAITFFAVPVVAFLAAVIFGGSGYLAAFVAGLLFTLTEHLHQSENYFNQTIEGFLKPIIFILLGAIVDLESLVATSLIGITSGLVFIFIIRPLAVVLSLGPLKIFRQGVSWRDIWFISFVRETGAIPAVLLITITSLGLPGLNGLVPIGMWVILVTLVLQPPLTPYIAEWLGVAERIEDTSAISWESNNDPFVVLGSRSHSYIQRLKLVADWADARHIKSIVLLHCLENNYHPDLVEKNRQESALVFSGLNAERQREGKTPLVFTYLPRQGFLQTNIEQIANSQAPVIAIFIGRKVLDYRLEDIKKLAAPLYFVP